MIEGSLSDISLASLLQLLCIESEKEYRLVLIRNHDRGEVLTARGYIVSSTYGILEGEDSLCELINWRQGSFSAARFSPEGQVPRNLALPFQATVEFIQDATYLTKQNVGLNSVISGSILFGTTSWKELVRRFPLDREALSVLAWLREGRSMRLAMREFELDLAQATAILKSLVITKSVDVIRIGREEVEAASLDSSETVSTLEAPNTTADEPAVAGAKNGKHAASSTLTRLPSLASGQVTSDSLPALPTANASGVPPLEVAYGRRVHAKSSLQKADAGISANANAPKLGAASETKKRTGLDELLRNAHKRNIEAAIESPSEVKHRPADFALNRYGPRTSETAEIEALKVPVPHDDPRFTTRTVALPLLALDIERLLRASFPVTKLGRNALANSSLDQNSRQTLLDAEDGNSLLTSVDQARFSPASILASFKDCLDRGYITTYDSVLPLTVDLLLGQIGIEQYLLQRRRISGDQLHDLINIATQEGIKLTQLLVKGGFLTAGDIETLWREQKRFAFK